MMKPKAGFERVYEVLMARKENLDDEKEIAIAEAVEKINKDFAEAEEELFNVLASIPMIEEADEEIKAEVEAEAEDEDAGEDLLVEEQPSEEVVNEEVVEG